MVKIGDIVYKYNMYTKRWAKWIVVTKPDSGRIGLSKVPRGGVASYAYPSELKKTKPRRKK